MDQPAWLHEAWAEYGQAEGKDSTNNPRIVALYKDAGHPKVVQDSVAWCAAFLGACLERSGITGTRSLMARSYMSWGSGLNAPRTGAIAVLTRSENTNLGHVGFVIGETADHIMLLGGNQGDAVTVSQFPKDRLLTLRWPLSTETETNTDTSPAPNRDETFARALAHVLKMEGGFTDDPVDPGGPTNKGITLAVYAAFKGETLNAGSRLRLLAELKSISDETLRAIYRERYWLKAGCEEWPAPLAVMHFDTAVNHGPGTAIRILQQVVRTDVDGEIGPRTRAAVAAMPMATALERYATNRRDRYRAMPHFWRFGRGWLARVESTLAMASAMVRETASASDSKGHKQMSDDIEQSGKWWGSSLTIWGAITTGLTALVPVLGPLIGLDITGELMRDLGQQSVAALQAILGVAGTIMTIIGRTRATQPIERRPFSLKL